MSRVFVTLIGISGVGYLSYLAGQEFDGVTVALFLVLSLLVVASITNVALGWRKLEAGKDENTSR